MRLIILFAGQGSQSLEDLAILRNQGSETLRKEFSDPTIDLAQLQENQNAQPFLFALQRHWWDQLQSFIPAPVAVSGYSLGALSAASAVGTFSAAEGLSLARSRAQAMDEAVTEPCGLLAVLGLRASKIEDLARDTRVFVAIQNGDQHFILGGNSSDLLRAHTAAEKAGAIRCQRLFVNTPSHTPILKSAAKNWSKKLAELSKSPLIPFPVLSGIDGRLLYSREQILQNLEFEICTRLNWQATLQAVIELRPDKVLEIGPGLALCKLLAELGPEIPARSTTDFRSLQGVKDWLLKS